MLMLGKGKCRSCANWEATNFDAKGNPLNIWANCKVSGKRTNISDSCAENYKDKEDTPKA